MNEPLCQYAVAVDDCLRENLSTYDVAALLFMRTVWSSLLEFVKAENKETYGAMHWPLIHALTV